MNNINTITITPSNVNDSIEFQQPDNQDVGVFTVRFTTGNWAPLDYSGGGRTLDDARTLEVQASSRASNQSIRVVLDWSAYNDAPNFTPGAGGPPFTWSTDAANKTTTLTFPIPTQPLAWFIWNTIGGEIPGINLRVKIKRLA